MTFSWEVDHEAVQNSEVLSHCFPITCTSKLGAWLCSCCGKLGASTDGLSPGTLSYCVGRDAPVGCCATWGNT